MVDEVGKRKRRDQRWEKKKKFIRAAQAARRLARRRNGPRERGRQPEHRQEIANRAFLAGYYVKDASRFFGTRRAIDRPLSPPSHKRRLRCRSCRSFTSPLRLFNFFAAEISCFLRVLLHRGNNAAGQIELARGGLRATQQLPSFARSRFSRRCFAQYERSFCIAKRR